MRADTAEFQSAARWGLFVLTLINILNYVDRYVVSALVESLRKSELALSDSQAGLLMTSFLLVYMLVAPIFGTLGDRLSRTKLMSVGVFIWSIATALGGFSNSFFSLMASRAFIGVGEAAYGTIAPALISDYYPAPARGQVFSLFYCAIPVGAALGYILGGYMDSHYGWRSAFFVAGVPGIILSISVWKMMDPPRGIHDNPIETPEHEKLSLSSTLAVYRDLLRGRAYTMTVLGYAAYTFALGALAFWIPAFLERERGLPKDQASTWFGLVVVATGFIGTVLGGWLADRFAARVRNSYLWLSGLSALFATPFAVGALYVSDLRAFWVCIVLAEILLFMSTGPINLAIIHAVPVGRRATAVALSILGSHLLGDVPSPPLIGWISDQSSLSRGMVLIPIAIAVSGVLWVVEASLSGRQDRALL